ncbi:MAG TPA: hypothetical protein PKD83_07835 [Ignavibacteria bacterium]|nr:hypothetical protein [Ignavibacteria bacterium]
MRENYLKFTLAVLTGAALLLFSFLPAIEFLLNFSNDDSFFYIKTAFNFSAGEGSTFDLINKTNGYHPLWFLILSFYFYVINLFSDFSPELYFRLVVLLINIVNAAIIYFMYKFFKVCSILNYKKQFALSVPLFLTFVAIRDYGMETHLACLIIIIYMYLKSDEQINFKSNFSLKIFLLILLFLTRIDFLFNVIPVIIIGDYLTAGADSERKKFLKYSVLLLSVTAVIYFSLNLFYFGNFLSIASKVKSSFPEVIFFKNFNDLFAPGTFTNQFIKSFYVFAVIMLFAIISFFNKEWIKFTETDKFLFIICLSSLIFIIFNLCFNLYTLKEWYVAFPTFICSLLLTRIINQFPRIYYFSLICFTMLLLYYFVLTRLNNPKWDSMYKYALELKNHTDPKDRILMIDLSGIVGFFSERKIVNGDGLINSFEYWNYKSSGKLKEFIDYKKINMYSTYSTSKGNHEMRDSSGFLIDMCYANKFGGYSFTFPKENLLMTAPYYYYHAVNSDKGNWYLFKLK